jgi:hypothetical protein
LIAFDEGWLALLRELQRENLEFGPPTGWADRVARFKEQWDAGRQPEPVPHLLLHPLDLHPRESVALARAEAELGVTASWSIAFETRRVKRWADDPAAWEAVREIQTVGHTIVPRVDLARSLRRGDPLASVVRRYTEALEAVDVSVSAIDVCGTAEASSDDLAGIAGALEIIPDSSAARAMFAVDDDGRRIVVRSLAPPYLLFEDEQRYDEARVHWTLLDLGRRAPTLWRVMPQTATALPLA